MAWFSVHSMHRAAIAAWEMGYGAGKRGRVACILPSVVLVLAMLYY